MSKLACVGCFNISESNGFTTFYPNEGYATLDMEGQWENWDIGRIYFCPVCGRSLKTLALLTQGDTEKLTKRIKGIFNSARFEYFEDGMDNIFYRELMPLLDSNEVVAVVAGIIDEICPAVASEALRCIGYADYSETHDSRLALLMHCLESSSGIVRDGAGLGLDSLGDLTAIPALKQAVEREANAALCNDLELVINDLETYCK